MREFQIFGCDKADSRQISLGVLRGLRLSSTRSLVIYTPHDPTHSPFSILDVVFIASYLVVRLIISCNVVRWLIWAVESLPTIDTPSLNVKINPNFY